MLAHLGRLHTACRKRGMRGFQILDAKRDRRGREVEAVRVVLHQRERYKLERKGLVGEPDLRDRETVGVISTLLDHTDLVDPEAAAGFRVVHVEHDVCDFHEQLPYRGALRHPEQPPAYAGTSAVSHTA